MTKVLAAAGLAAAMLAGTAAASYAAIVPTGAVDIFTGNFGSAAPVGTGTEYFSFSIPFGGGFTVSASVTTAATSKTTFSAFNFYNTDGTTVGPAGFANPNNKNYALNAFTFQTGNYFVGVTTTSSGNVSLNRGFSGNLAVSSVPLPTSVALFGTAIAGLGVAGAVRRKGQKAAPAV